MCGHRSMYSSLCTELASHGYIVIAPEHTDGSACLARRGNEFVQYVSRQGADLSGRLQERVKELLACWNCLASVDGGRFADSISCSSCILLGHSFGARTILGAAAEEEFQNRTRLVILDPWMSPFLDASQTFPSPTLAILTGSMLWEPNASELVCVLSAMNTDSDPAFLTEVIDARHQDISDVPFFLHVPMALLSACSQLKSGNSVWRTYSELMLRFLKFEKEPQTSKIQALLTVPGARVHSWQRWIYNAGHKM